MHMKNKNITELKSLLYSRTESGKITINQAIAYGVVIKSNILDEATDVRMTIKNIVNEVAELAILDRVGVEKAITNMYLFTHIKESINNHSLTVKYPLDFETAMFLSELIGKATVEAIDENMKLFNNIANLISTSLSDIIDD